VFVVPKHCSRQFFFQSLRLAGAARSRLLVLHRENARLQTAIEEIRIVDRAKCALIQCLMMTEPQAHRHIEKQAMDLRVSKLDVAKTILKTYEV
jgi:response regulator NasT